MHSRGLMVIFQNVLIFGVLLSFKIAVTMNIVDTTIPLVLGLKIYIMYV